MALGVHGQTGTLWRGLILACDLDLLLELQLFASTFVHCAFSYQTLLSAVPCLLAFWAQMHLNLQPLTNNDCLPCAATAIMRLTNQSKRSCSTTQRCDDMA